MIFSEGNQKYAEYISVYHDKKTGLAGFAFSPSYEEALVIQAAMVIDFGMTELGNQWRFKKLHEEMGTKLKSSQPMEPKVFN